MGQATPNFYTEWLGIRAEHCPPNHYELLGVERGESDEQVLVESADQRSRLVKTHQLKHPEEATRFLNQIALACICLTNPEQKLEYDKQLATAETAPPDAGGGSPTTEETKPANAEIEPKHAGRGAKTRESASKHVKLPKQQSDPADEAPEPVVGQPEAQTRSDDIDEVFDEFESEPASRPAESSLPKRRSSRRARSQPPKTKESAASSASEAASAQGLKPAHYMFLGAGIAVAVMATGLLIFRGVGAEDPGDPSPASADADADAAAQQAASNAAVEQEAKDDLRKRITELVEKEEFAQAIELITSGEAEDDEEDELLTPVREAYLAQLKAWTETFPEPKQHPEIRTAFDELKPLFLSQESVESFLPDGPDVRESAMELLTLSRHSEHPGAHAEMVGEFKVNQPLADYMTENRLALSGFEFELAPGAFTKHEEVLAAMDRRTSQADPEGKLQNLLAARLEALVNDHCRESLAAADDTADYSALWDLLEECDRRQVSITRPRTRLITKWYSFELDRAVRSVRAAYTAGRVDTALTGINRVLPQELSDNESNFRAVLKAEVRRGFAGAESQARSSAEAQIVQGRYLSAYQLMRPFVLEPERVASLGVNVKPAQALCVAALRTAMQTNRMPEALLRAVAQDPLQDYLCQQIGGLDERIRVLRFNEEEAKFLSGNDVTEFQSRYERALQGLRRRSDGRFDGVTVVLTATGKSRPRPDSPDWQKTKPKQYQTIFQAALTIAKIAAEHDLAERENKKEKPWHRYRWFATQAEADAFLKPDEKEDKRDKDNRDGDILDGQASDGTSSRSG